MTILSIIMVRIEFWNSVCYFETTSDSQYWMYSTG